MAEAEGMLKEEEGGGGGEGRENQPMAKNRKEKRKEMKKMKRKQVRKEAAEMERVAEEARLNDPEEQKRIHREEEEERKRIEIALKEFEERERAWIEAMEIKRKAQDQEEEEEKKRKDLKADADGEQEELDDDWEYAEEGPAEIIWQGNEIIVRKKKVKVPKKDANQKSKEEDADRPTSNPLPPQSEAFSEYWNASSAQQMLESVAKEVPNFGTEQDKAHCPFHLKTGACRFGQRCSRVHFYPDKSCTLLIRNMYNGPGLAWEQDEGLEYTDEEVERCYEEFYEDVHTEFLKFGEIVNFKVCRNGSFHLRGNVYVHYKSLESAILAYHSINGRYFAGKQVKCEFVNVTKWKVAICGEFMKSRLKICSHGTACNFIHCFRNPGGDYEWADWDKPPPRYWVKEMAALFGYSEEAGFEKQIEQEHSWQSRNYSRMVKSDAERHRSRRSKSREMDRSVGGDARSPYSKDDVRESSRSQRDKYSDKEQRSLDGRSKRQGTSLKWAQNSERIHDTNSDGGYSDSRSGKNSDKEQIKVLDGRYDKQSRSLKRDRSSETIHDTDSDEGYSDSHSCKVNDREQTENLDGRSERRGTSLKRGRSSERIHDTSYDEGYSESRSVKNNDRKQAKALDGRSDRWRGSLKRDRSRERVNDNSSNEGYSDSRRGKHNDRKQTKVSDGRSDRWRGSVKQDRSGARADDTSSDEGYLDSRRGKHNDRRTKVLDGRSDRWRGSSKRDRRSEVDDTSSDEGYSDSRSGKHNDRKQTKVLDGRSERWGSSFKVDEKNEGIHDTSSDGDYSERDINGTRDTDKVRHHKHSRKNRKGESSEYLANSRNIQNRVSEDGENTSGETKKRTRHRSRGG